MHEPAADPNQDRLLNAKKGVSMKYGHTVMSHAASLAEAVILQAIEDLWNPMWKRDSLSFFEGSGFALYSEIAGISNTKQFAIIRMLANAGQKPRLRNLITAYRVIGDDVRK